MGFDAGTIEARLTVSLDQARRGLREFETELRRVEHARRRVSLSAFIDPTELIRAR